MPELPEVETVLRTLEPQIAGRRVSRVEIRKPKLARPTPEALRRGITGATVERLARHGKLMILEMDRGGYWTIHLGMTGQVIFAAQKPQADHLHITVSFDDGGPRLYYRDPRMFGAVGYWPDRAALEAGPLKNMGPDALSLDADGLCQALAGRTAPIKALLLDQRILAGVGNIYADECLHRAGITPLAKPRDLSEERIRALHGSLAETLAEALATGGSSVKNFVDANGRPGTFQEAHRVYQRTGCACPRCGGEICRTVVAGRSTHYCPACQLD